MFDACEICGTKEWAEAYRGPVRQGAFGSVIAEGVVGCCGGCGAQRLAERFCPAADFYESPAYRESLKQGLDSQSYFEAHDGLVQYTLDLVRLIADERLTAA